MENRFKKETLQSGTANCENWPKLYNILSIFWIGFEISTKELKLEI